MNLSISLFTDFNKTEICCKENSFKLFTYNSRLILVFELFAKNFRYYYI